MPEDKDFGVDPGEFNQSGNIIDKNASPEKLQKPPPESDYIEKATEKAHASQKQFEDKLKTFDPNKIADYDYLLDLFKSNKGSFQYLKKIHQQMLKANYEENPTMHEYLFYSVISRRLQISYQESHINASGKEDFPVLREIEKITEKKAQLQSVLDKQRENKEKTLDIVDLHHSMIDLAETEIRTHIGEHAFRCEQCGSMVNTQGLPHWAIETKIGPDGSPVHFIFSPELWFLIKKKLIPIHIMAFALRTSIEGVTYTAKERGNKDIPKIDYNVEEKELRKLMDEHYG